MSTYLRNRLEMDEQDIHSTESFASGGLATVLRVGRVAGIAPLRFVKAGDGWSISSSIAWSVYGSFTITIINCITVTSLISAIKAEHRNTQCAVWAVQSSFMMLASGIAVYSAPALMRSTILCLNQLHKINGELNIHRWPIYLGRYEVRMAVIQMIVCLSLSLINYAQDIISEFQVHEKLWINIVYIFYFFSYWILQLRNLLFIAIVLFVKYSFKVVNNNLKNLLEDLDSYNKTPLSKELITVIKKYTRFNNYVNTLTDPGNNGSVTINSKLTSDHKTVRRLSLMFAALCGVVREVDHTHGPMLLIVLANLFLHLICTPYFFIIYLLTVNDVTSSYLAVMNAIKLAIQLLWCLYHTFSLVTLVEPCHLTHMEMVKTRELVGHLMRCTSSGYDPLAIELEQFFRYLLLNEVSYAPLKIIKITRKLIFMILGSITTFTVVILHI